MARFVYHSRLPGNLVAVIGAGAAIASVAVFGVFKLLAHPPNWMYVLVAVLVGAGILALAVSRFIDKRTLRVDKVMPFGSDKKKLEMAVDALGEEPPEANERFAEMHWEIGPTSEQLRTQWRSTLVLGGLAGVAMAFPILWPGGLGRAWNEAANVIGLSAR